MKDRGSPREVIGRSGASDNLIVRPTACPREGQIKPFDAGWHAHEVGLSRETVRVLAADPGWALLGWDTRNLVAAAVPSREPEGEA